MEPCSPNPLGTPGRAPRTFGCGGDFAAEHPPGRGADGCRRRLELCGAIEESQSKTAAQCSGPTARPRGGLSAGAARVRTPQRPNPIATGAAHGRELVRGRVESSSASRSGGARRGRTYARPGHIVDIGSNRLVTAHVQGSRMHRIWCHFRARTDGSGQTGKLTRALAQRPDIAWDLGMGRSR